MTTTDSTAPARRWPAGPRWLAWAALGWMVVILVLGVTMAVRLAGGPVLGEAARTFWSESVVLAAAVVYAAVAVPTLLVWLLRRSLTIPAALLAAALVVAVGGLLTDSVAALAVVAAQTALAWLIGAAVVRLAVPPPVPPPVPALAGAVLAFATGSGALGLAYLLLGSVGLLTGPAIVAVDLALVLAAAVVVLRNGRPAVRAPAWGRPALSSAVLVALVAGFVAFGLLYAFVPETLSDAVRHHLPITREIWQTGSVPELPWWTSRYPIHAQVVSVPAWAIGGMAGVSLSHAVVGLMAGAGAAALAQLLGGRFAGIIAAATFMATPLFLWEIGHAYVDLYPALFMVASAIAVVLWQRTGAARVLVLAGFLAGMAFAAKTVAATAVGALGLAVLLVGRERFTLRSRFTAGLAMLAGGLITFPWLWRSFAITGTFPGLDLLMSILFGTERDVAADLEGFGVGRDPLSILLMPWSMTFDGGLFGPAGAGAIGVVFLMALPLVVFAPRSRPTALVLVAVGLGLLAWAFTAQYLRYSLPLLVLASGLVGAGAAGLRRILAAAGPRWVPASVAWLVVAAIVLTPFMALPTRRSQVPVDFWLARMDRDEAAAELIRGYGVLRASSDIVGADRPLLWLGGIASEVYTEAAVEVAKPAELGTTDDEVREALDGRGVEFVAWERNGSPEDYWDSHALSLGFLEAQTELVAAEDGTYLFRLVAASEAGPGAGWDLGTELLPPPSDSEGGWELKGEAVAEGDGLVTPRGSSAKVTVAAEPETAYAVVVRGACGKGGPGELVILVQWKDDDGRFTGRDRQPVVLGESGTTFALTISPPDTSSAIVQLTPRSGDCLLTDVSMRELGAASP